MILGTQDYSFFS